MALFTLLSLVSGYLAMEDTLILGLIILISLGTIAYTALKKSDEPEGGFYFSKVRTVEDFGPRRIKKKKEGDAGGEKKKKDKKKK